MAARVKQRATTRGMGAKRPATGRRAAPPAPAAEELPRPRFFRTPAVWRAWLATHHRERTSLWVGFWRVATGRPSITWPQSVDEALCFGWIDGLRRGLDGESYMIRFTPRKTGSAWSRVNLARFAALEAAGRVRASGRAARAQWSDARRAGYAHETPNRVLDRASLAALRKNARAWAFWEAQLPSYRKMAGHWVVSARREATRTARLATLTDCCARGAAVPPVAKYVQVKRPGR